MTGRGEGEKVKVQVAAWQNIIMGHCGVDQKVGIVHSSGLGTILLYNVRRSSEEQRMQVETFQIFSQRFLRK